MNPRCPNCQSQKFKKNGIIRKTTQQYKCKVCGARFTLTKRRKNFEEKKFMAIRLYLCGLSYRNISRELRVSDMAVRNWIQQIKKDDPNLEIQKSIYKDFNVYVTVRDLSQYANLTSTQRVNENIRNGGLFIESNSKFLHNKVIHVELLPKILTPSKDYTD